MMKYRLLSVILKGSLKASLYDEDEGVYIAGSDGNIIFSLSAMAVKLTQLGITSEVVTLKELKQALGQCEQVSIDGGIISLPIPTKLLGDTDDF